MPLHSSTISWSRRGAACLLVVGLAGCNSAWQPGVSSPRIAQRVQVIAPPEGAASAPPAASVALAASAPPAITSGSGTAAGMAGGAVASSTPSPATTSAVTSTSAPPAVPASAATGSSTVVGGKPADVANVAPAVGNAGTPAAAPPPAPVAPPTRVAAAPSTARTDEPPPTGRSNVRDASAGDDPRLPTAIYFGPDAYKVRPNDMAIVQAHARRLQASPSLHLTLRAYADRFGAPDYNLALSRKRADTVRKLLIAQGARPQQIDIVSEGERRGSAMRSRGGASDRRVEFVYR